MINSARLLGTFASLDHPSERDMSWFDNQRVATSFVRNLPIKVAHVQMIGDRFLFDHHAPCSNPTRVFVLLACDLLAEPFDILAWDLKTNTLATWLGVAWCWGEETILRPVSQDPLFPS